MNINPVQFGKLVLREKSIRTIGGEEMLKDFRSAKKYHRNVIDILDKAGMDIEIRMTENKEQGKEVFTSLVNKQREAICFSIDNSDSHPWSILASVMTLAFQHIDIQQASVKPPMMLSEKVTLSGKPEKVLIKTKGRGVKSPAFNKNPR